MQNKKGKHKLLYILWDDLQYLEGVPCQKEKVAEISGKEES